MSRRTVAAYVKPALRVGVTWSVLWLVATLVGGIGIAIVDPDSIDPGEGWMALVIFAPMGFVSGVAFALLSLTLDTDDPRHWSIWNVLLRGFIGSALVQLALLNHGDAGLQANLQMALVLAIFGALVGGAWLLVSRRWQAWGIGDL